MTFRPKPFHPDVQRRRAIVLDLYDQGATLQQVADKIIDLGLAPTPRDGKPARYTKRDVANDMNKALQGYISVAADRLRAHQNHQLTRMLAGLLPAARGGDVPSVMAAVRVMERQAKLNGLDAPVHSTLEISSHLDMVVQLLLPVVTQAIDVLDLPAEQRTLAFATMQQGLAALEAAQAPAPTLRLVEAEDD